MKKACPSPASVLNGACGLGASRDDVGLAPRSHLAVCATSGQTLVEPRHGRPRRRRHHFTRQLWTLSSQESLGVPPLLSSELSGPFALNPDGGQHAYLPIHSWPIPQPFRRLPCSDHSWLRSARNRYLTPNGHKHLSAAACCDKYRSCPLHSAVWSSSTRRLLCCLHHLPMSTPAQSAPRPFPSPIVLLSRLLPCHPSSCCGSYTRPLLREKSSDSAKFSTGSQ